LTPVLKPLATSLGYLQFCLGEAEREEREKERDRYIYWGGDVITNKLCVCRYVTDL
jgi:hypothetical protein